MTTGWICFWHCPDWRTCADTVVRKVRLCRRRRSADTCVNNSSIDCSGDSWWLPCSLNYAYKLPVITGVNPRRTAGSIGAIFFIKTAVPLIYNLHESAFGPFKKIKSNCVSPNDTPPHKCHWLRTHASTQYIAWHSTPHSRDSHERLLKIRCVNFVWVRLGLRVMLARLGLDYTAHRAVSDDRAQIEVMVASWIMQ